MSSNEDVQRPFKRKFTDIKEEPRLETNEEKIYENNDQLDPVVKDFIKKYSNPRDLEVLYHRWMLYSATGVYIPPEQFRLDCQKTKSKKSKQPQALVESLRKDFRTTFGKGQVGAGETTCGTKICKCCPFIEVDNSNIATLNDKCTNKNCIKNKVSNMSESLPSCSGLQVKTETVSVNDFTMQEVNQIADLVQYLNSDSVLDLSNTSVKLENVAETEKEMLNSSDSSGTIIDDNYNNSIDNIHFLLNMENTNTSNTALDLSTTSIKSEENIDVTSNNELFTDDSMNNINLSTPNSSVINVSDTSHLHGRVNEHIDVVDLTNISVSQGNTWQRLANGRVDPDVIELLDDTFQTNLTPGVIETIDLIDSDSDTEISLLNPKVKSDSKRCMECPICLENLKDKKIMSTICGHIFCHKCIRSAIKSKKSCPNCRKKLTMSGIHPLYWNF